MTRFENKSLSSGFCKHPNLFREGVVQRKGEVLKNLIIRIYSQNAFYKIKTSEVTRQKINAGNT